MLVSMCSCEYFPCVNGVERLAFPSAGFCRPHRVPQRVCSGIMSNSTPLAWPLFTSSSSPLRLHLKCPTQRLFTYALLISFSHYYSAAYLGESTGVSRVPVCPPFRHIDVTLQYVRTCRVWCVGDRERIHLYVE